MFAAVVVSAPYLNMARCVVVWAIRTPTGILAEHVALWVCVGWVPPSPLFLLLPFAICFLIV